MNDNTKKVFVYHEENYYYLTYENNQNLIVSRRFNSGDLTLDFISYSEFNKEKFKEFKESHRIKDIPLNESVLNDLFNTLKHFVNFCFGSLTKDEKTSGIYDELIKKNPAERQFLYQKLYSQQYEILNNFECTSEFNFMPANWSDDNIDQSDYVVFKEFLAGKGNDVEVDYLLNQDLEMHKGCYIDSYTGLFYYDLDRIIEGALEVKQCKNCGNYFIPEKRKDTEYCNRIIEGNDKKCSEIGANKVYQEKIGNDPIMKIYNKIYKRMNARVRYQLLSKTDFDNWKELAKALRDKAYNENTPPQEFEKWLNLFKNI